MAAMLFVLALFVKFSPLPEPDLEDDGSEEEVESRSLASHPQLVLGAVALFFYVGAEVIAGDTIGLFGKELGVANFAQLTSYTMSFMVTGYILGMIAIPRWITQATALILSAILGLVFSLALIFSGTESSSLWDALFAWTGVAPSSHCCLVCRFIGFGQCHDVAGYLAFSVRRPK